MRLIERSRIDALLAEQEIGQSGVIDPPKAIEAGKLLGAEAT